MISQSSGTVLYVDDETQALKYFAQIYGDRFDITTACSADEALEIIEADPDRIAVLLTDQRMPGKTGVELMEIVRSRHPNIVRVLTTAYTNLESAIKAVNEGGAFRYLTKPWNEGEMIGVLLRATEYHAVMKDRDRLLNEKLSVLHRLIVMDRVRGLATMATAINGQVRDAWSALVGYMEQSPVSQRIQVQMEEIAGLNMVALARHEAEAMVKTVQMVLNDTTGKSTGDESSIDVSAIVREYAQQATSELSEDDLELTVENADQSESVEGDRGMIQRVLQIMVRRLSDVQELPSKIKIEMKPSEDAVEIAVRGGFGALEPAQVASFFAAAIPLKKWPIGLDMDVLSCFMIAHHMGGHFRLELQSEFGPSLVVTLPRSSQSLSSAPSSEIDPAWFDTVYDSLEQWQTEILSEM